MSDLEKTVKEFYQRFPNVPSPTHEPKRFAWFVKLFKYYQARYNKSSVL